MKRETSNQLCLALIIKASSAAIALYVFIASLVAIYIKAVKKLSVLIWDQREYQIIHQNHQVV